MPTEARLYLMDKERFYILVTKSQTEKLSEEEQSELQHLIASNPELKEEARFIMNFWRGIEFTVDADGNEVFSRIKRAINQRPVIPLYHEEEPELTKPGRNFNIIKIAAAVAFFLLAGFLAFYVIRTTGSFNEKRVAVRTVKSVEKKVLKGQRLRIFLPDGSMVWLNSESKIVYPEAFSGHTRTIELEGEAFFEVKKNPEKPFVVKTGDLTTTALGTSFNVRAYESERSVYVALVTGKLLVELKRKDDARFILDPGYGVQYTKKSGAIRKEKPDIDKIIGWKEGILRFDGDDFETVIRKLSRWYGVDFVIEGNPGVSKDWRFTGWFRDDYLDIVLKSMSYTKGFEFEIDNKKVTIKFKEP